LRCSTLERAIIIFDYILTTTGMNIEGLYILATSSLSLASKVNFN
jgi:hypothetical protein